MVIENVGTRVIVWHQLPYAYAERYYRLRLRRCLPLRFALRYEHSDINGGCAGTHHAIRDFSVSELVETMKRNVSCRIPKRNGGYRGRTYIARVTANRMQREQTSR